MAFILCLYIRLGVVFLNCFIVERCASYSAASRFYKLDVWLSLIGFDSFFYFVFFVMSTMIMSILFFVSATNICIWECWVTRCGYICTWNND